MYFLTLTVLSSVQYFVEPKTNFGVLETARNPFQYLEEQNYYYENHTVITEDGYKLLLVRIPRNRKESPTSTSNKPPVLLVHGILSSFFDYLATGPGISFGFRALEMGYDVFMINTRGNRWSRNHTTLHPDLHAEQFWNYSYHEVGYYDLPATIDYIINLTGYPKISYVGISHGTTCFLVMTSARPEYNKKLRVAILLAPVAYLHHGEFFLLVMLKDRVRDLEILAQNLELREFLPYTPFVSRLGHLACNEDSIMFPICTLGYETMGQSSQMNKSMLATYFTNFPMGTAVKEFIHYLQIGCSGKFRRYDYGKKGNLIQYGQSTPPDYKLGAVSTPTALYYGDSDSFIDPRDIRRLIRELPNVVRNVLVAHQFTNHFDVAIGTKSSELFTEPALKVLNEYNQL